MAATPSETKFRRRSGSTERLEMSNLNGHHSHEEDPLNDVDNDSDGENEGERALLGSENRQRHVSTKGAQKANMWRIVRAILIEAVPTLALTTLGLTFTGELLQRVSGWQALQRVNELYILIPTLNNLKGNLEMNLSSRLSTSVSIPWTANIGELDVLSIRRTMLLGNLSLLQVQALLISAVAGVLSFLLGLILSATSGSSSTQPRAFSAHKRKLPPIAPLPANQSQSGLRELGVLLCTAMTSASLSGLILGSFMCTLVVMCRRWHRDPDNITPPIASCLGDLLTLCIISLVSSVIVRTIDTVLPIVLIVFLICCAVSSIILTLRNNYAKHLIFLGWTPLLGAMLISSFSGVILDRFVNRYQDYGLLSVVFNGLPGAVGSIHISRLSTSLHAPHSNSFKAHNESTPDSKPIVTSTTLFLVSLLVQGLFLTFLYVTGWVQFPFLFVVIFVVLFCTMIIMSLTIAQLLTQFLWRRNLDPDSYAMPIHSSVVDLLGQLTLVVCYEISQALGVTVNVKTNT